MDKVDFIAGWSSQSLFFGIAIVIDMAYFGFKG